MYKEYKAISIIIPENYATVVVDKGEFEKIIKDNYNKKCKAIVYNLNGFRYLLDTNADVVVQTEG